MNSPLASVAYSFVNESTNAGSNTGINWGLWLSVVALTLTVVGFFAWYWNLLKPVSESKSQKIVPLKPVAQADTSVLLEQEQEQVLQQKIQESWCFVGEDKTGRWCLRVPSSHACDPDRTYTSLSECELVTASEMPLGFLKNGGVSSMPLSAIPVMSNTEVV